MAALNARLIAKASGTASEVPQTADLEVAELAINTADALLYSKHTDGSVITIGGSSVTSIDDLSDVDISTAAPLDEHALTWDSANSEFVPGFPRLSITSFSSVNTTTSAAIQAGDLLGDDLEWTSSAATADGWTVALDTGSSVDDDKVSVSVPANFQGLNFFGQTMPSQIAVGGNGQIFWNADGSYTSNTGRTGNISTDATGKEFWLSFMSQDSAMRRIDHKLYNSNTEWVVKIFYRLPFTSTTGYTVETTFKTDGSIRVVYGDNTGDNITISSNHQGLVVDGTVLVAGFGASASASGNFTFEVTGTYTASGRNLSDLADVNSSAVPTDGQALVWDNANSQWVPGTVASGGGAVDSVNGETGVVSLGIQDMDDFQLEGVANTLVLDNRRANPQDPSAEGDFHAGEGRSDFQYAKGGSNETTILQIGVGNDITFEFKDSGGTTIDTHSTTRATSATNDWDGNTGYINITDAFPSGTGINSAASVTISSTVLGQVDIQLAQGDILQWDNTDQKFKPAQLPAAVSSVNSQTGVVSLGVQDMDDFALNTVIPAPTSTRYTLDHVGSTQPGNGVASDEYIANRFVMGLLDADGADPRNVFGTDISTSGVKDMWYSKDESTWTQVPLTLFKPAGNYYELVTTGSQYWSGPTDGDFDTWTEIYFTDTDPNSISPVDVPLAEGDVLRWNNTDGKFKPAVPAEADLSTESINALSDVDTATNAPTSNQVLIWDGSNWVPGDQTGGGSGVSRTSVSVATSSLADQAAENIEFAAAGKTGTFVTVQTDVAAWVTFYTDTGSRTSDSVRSQTTSPSPGSGVLLEVITTGAQTIRITPAIGYFNDDTVLSSNLLAKVVNLSGGTTAVTTTIEVVTLES